MDAATGRMDDFIVYTAADRADLWESCRGSFHGVWPEYNRHGETAGRIFDALLPDYAGFQVLIYDAAREEVVGRGKTIPMSWDGTLEDLPPGLDVAGTRALSQTTRADTLCALSAEVTLSAQGRNISRLVIAAMARQARSAGLKRFVAPVRPNRKDLYPTIDIEDYAAWQRHDGLPFDPWMRVHVRLGATILRPEPRSLLIEGTVREWESWTEMAFPAPGRYVFPGGLSLLEVDRDRGTYWEPNVWMSHPL
jgi:hypothetical protein